MKQEQVPVTVRILDKEYCVACAPHEREELWESARLVDRRMREMRQSGRVIGPDRIAVMAALNLAHELIQLRHQQALATPIADSNRLQSVQQRLAGAIDAQRGLDLPSESV